MFIKCIVVSRKNMKHLFVDLSEIARPSSHLGLKARPYPLEHCVITERPLILQVLTEMERTETEMFERWDFHSRK